MAQSKVLAKAVALAKATRLNAHSPYSKVKVGACVVTQDGDLFGGCNVENSSYGGTICAERTAVFSAVAAKGPLEISHIVIATDAPDPWPPCGFCRQVLREFCKDPGSLKITLVNLAGKKKLTTLEKLLPLSFAPSHLLSKK